MDSTYNDNEYNEYNDSKYHHKKPSYYISYDTALNILHTFDYARFCGRPLNLAVTINFYDDYNAPAKFQIIRSRISRWLKNQRVQSLYPLDHFWAFTIENPHGNVHVNFACHVEDELREDFEDKVIELTNEFAPTKNSNQIHFKTITALTDKVYANYMIKGVLPDTAKRLHIEEICAYQGPIYGQRARSCTRLSRTARKRADFRPPIHRHLWVSMYPSLLKGLCLTNWDVSKVIPNAASIRTIDEMFDNFAEENQKLLDSGLNVEKTGCRRRKKNAHSPAKTLGSCHGF